jgi:hypothetical protein
MTKTHSLYASIFKSILFEKVIKATQAQESSFPNYKWIEKSQNKVMDSSSAQT